MDLNDRNLICGGTILGKNIFVTAAHCVVRDKCFAASDERAFQGILEATDANHDEAILGYDVKKLKKCNFRANFFVQAGVTDLNLNDGSERRLIQRHGVRWLSIADNFFKFHNDVAVLTLTRPFRFNGVVRPACLPDSSLTINP